MTIDPNNLAATAHLTFDDEFNTLSLWNGTSGTWATDWYYDALNGNGSTLSGNGEQEWYINNNDAATASVTPWTVNNGLLNLTAAPAPAAIQALINNYQYTSGMLNSYHSFSQTYGYFEINAKLPAGQGFWPAFWLLPENGSWPPELDVMEVLGNDPTKLYTTVHYNSDNESMSQGETVANTSTGFHTYGVDWEPDYITWYFDGQQVYKVATPSDMTGANASPMYMILNLAVGGYWPGNVDSTTQLPNAMQVDWVRAYASGPDSSSGGGTTSTGGSSTGSGSTSGSGSTTTTTGLTLNDYSDAGIALTGGAGDDTLIASHGADTLTGGAGSDVFQFPVIPWSASQVTDFTPGVDKLDFSALLSSKGYAGSDPIADGWLSFVDDGKGDTLVYLSPHDGSNNGYPYLITTLDGVTVSQIVESRDVIFSTGAATTGSGSTTSGGGGSTTTSGGTTSSGGGSTASSGGTGSTGSSSGTGSSTTPGVTLSDPNNTGISLTGGAGADTLIASYGADTLAGGAGSDVFQFPVIPWSAGQVTDFTPGVDKLDLSALLTSKGYAGSDPVADGWISFVDDGKGDTLVYLNPHDGSNNGYPYLITTLDGVTASQIVESRDVILPAASTTTSTTTTPPPASALFTLPASPTPTSTLTASAGHLKLTAGSGAVLLDAHDLQNVTMTGGTGGDTFKVYFTSDKVVAQAGGVDTVDSYASSYTLPANVENLTLTGSTAQTGAGNSLNNILTSNDHGSTLNGGAGNDILIAGHSADTLTGGSGADIFVFNATPWSAGQITDFTPGVDMLDLRGLFSAAHYAGGDPVKDGWLTFSADGKGDTLVYFSPHDGSNGGYPYLITTLDHVAPTSLVAGRDWFFH